MSKKDADLEVLDAVAGHLIRDDRNKLSAADRKAMKRLGWSEAQFREVRGRMRGLVDRLPGDLKAQAIGALASAKRERAEETRVDPAIAARLEADAALMVEQARAGLPITRPWRNRRSGPSS